MVGRQTLSCQTTLMFIVALAIAGTSESISTIGLSQTRMKPRYSLVIGSRTHSASHCPLRCRCFGQESLLFEGTRFMRTPRPFTRHCLLNYSGHVIQFKATFSNEVGGMCSVYNYTRKYIRRANRRGIASSHEHGGSVWVLLL